MIMALATEGLRFKTKCEFPQGLKPNSPRASNGAAEGAAEKVVATKKPQIPLGWKPLGMTK